MLRILICLFCLLPASVAAQCRQALALGLDVSGSVDSQEYRLQLDGLAAALSHPEVSQALLAVPSAPVRLAVFEWSETRYQRMLLPWRDIRSSQDIAGVAARLRQAERASAPPGTAIGAAMQFGASLLRQQDDCWKRTLDLSGDGRRNLGPHPRDVKAALSREDLTINGLVIGADTIDVTDLRQVQIGELSAYFRAWVISGPDAFVETALGYRDFESAMIRKLKKELESLAISALPFGGNTRSYDLPVKNLPQ